MNPVARLRRAEWAVLAALFLLAFCSVLLTSNDYGATYDEPHYASAGARYAAWWASAWRSPGDAFQRDAITAAWHLNHEHPPLQKVASGFCYRWFGALLPGLMAMRLPSALWFALAVCALFLFTRGIWGFGGAIFSALALATMPRVVAHAHFDALDMVITAWFFITTALTAEAMRRGSWWYAALAGVAFGLALLAKVNAFFLPVLLVPWGLVCHRQHWPKLLAVMLMGPAIFFLGWPWLWIAPLPHLRGYLDFHFQHAAYNVWYLGKLYQYAPWHYPFVMTAVTTPTLLLLAALIGIVACWPRRGADPRRALLLWGLIVTLAPSALPSSPKYNGVRLFLPAFPFLAALAGGGYAWLRAKLLRLPALLRPENVRLAVLLPTLLAVALLAPSLTGVVHTHPYQLAYYNALVGGTSGATRRGFETIYWGQVFAEGVEFVNALKQPRPRLLVIPKGVIYLFTLQQVRPDAQFTADESQAGSVDYVIFQCMQSDFTDLCWQLYRHARPAYAVTLEGTPLLVAYDRAAGAAALGRLREQRAPRPAPSEHSASSERKSPTLKLAGS
jgi:4-amino-4-deoxy-L-arabinose transferase-like glycosyltransferase